MTEAPSHGDFGEYARKVRSIVDEHVVGSIGWYQNHKSTPRKLYKSSVVSLASLGAVVSLTSLFPGGTARILAGVVGVLITAVSSLSTSYGWKESWQAFTWAQTELEGALGAWELEMTSAQDAAHVSEQERRDRAQRATELLLASAREIRAGELRRYFRSDSDSLDAFGGRGGTSSSPSSP